jgi:hypothetical protein
MQKYRQFDYYRYRAWRSIRRECIPLFILSQLTAAVHCVILSTTNNATFVVTVRRMLPHLMVTCIYKTKRLNDMFFLHLQSFLTKRHCRELVREFHFASYRNLRSRYSDWLRAGRPSDRSSSPARGNIFLLSRSVLGPTQPPVSIGGYFPGMWSWLLSSN